jgi:hypothetical protein
LLYPGKNVASGVANDWEDMAGIAKGNPEANATEQGQNAGVDKLLRGKILANSERILA